MYEILPAFMKARCLAVQLMLTIISQGGLTEMSPTGSHQKKNCSLGILQLAKLLFLIFFFNFIRKWIEQLKNALFYMYLNSVYETEPTKKVA